MNEHRQFIRHPADVPIEFAPDVQEEPSESGQAQNVSLGGLSFQADRCPEEGRVIEIRIPVVQPVFETRGRVVWCRARETGFEVGVEFLEASDAFRMRMVEQVCQIERYRQEVREREGRELTGNAAAQEWIRKFGAAFPNPPMERAG